MKIIGIYPGRFQPAHRGHLGVYKRLKQISGADTFIATTDKTPTPDSPLNFGEKQQIWVRHGVPSNNVVKVKNTYSPTEITQNFMPETTAAVYTLGSKDVVRFGSKKARNEKTGKEMWMKADGQTLSYFQPYKGNERDMKSLDKHGYVMIIDDIKIDGKPISGRTVREALSSLKYTPNQKKKFFQWAFGWFDPSLYEMMVDVFSKAAKATSTIQQPTQPSVVKTARTISKESLRRVVSEILKEFTKPQGDLSTPDPTQTNDLSATNRANTALQAKKDSVKAKAQATRELDSLKKDLKWKQSDVIRKRKDDIPNKQKEIDDLNKAMSGGVSVSTTSSTSY
jgi:hypothetical protein